MAGSLVLVGTPIGNLGDLSERARETLAEVDLVVAEDTRRTGRLLWALGLRKPLLSMFEGNEDRRAEEIVARLEGNEDIAVVTDGGMPSISDPGYRLVRLAIDRGFEVRVVPGPSAAVAALVVSGLPTDRFSFEGFLPRRRGDRSRRLAEVRADPRTLVFFESPRRTVALLRELREALGDRRGGGGGGAAGGGGARGLRGGGSPPGGAPGAGGNPPGGSPNRLYRATLDGS